MATVWENQRRASRDGSLGKWIGIAVVLVVLVTGASTMATYNGLVAGDQRVKAQWAQVENAYQRRLDLVPNLVNTVRAVSKWATDSRAN
jgi:hypothetical protein